MTDKLPDDVAQSRRIVLFMIVVLLTLLVSLAYGPVMDLLRGP